MEPFPRNLEGGFLRELRRFEFLSENANDAHLVYDRRARILYANRVASERLGYSRQELLNLTVPDISPTFPLERLHDLFEQAKQGRVAPFEAVHRRKDGSTFPVEVTASLVEVEGNDLLFSASRDITARKRVETERDRFFSVGTDMLVIADCNGFFKWVSPAWEATLGWRLEDLTSHPWLDFVHPADVKRTVDEAAKLYQGHPVFEFENRYRCADGSYRWLRWKCKSFPLEGRLYGGATDITDLKQTQTTLEHKTRRLELLINATARLFASDSPDRIVREIFSDLKREFPVDVYFNYMLADSKLVLDSSGGVEEDQAREVTVFPWGQPVCGTVANTRKPWTVSNVQQSESPALPFLRRIGVRAYTCNPLIVGDQLIGTLSFGSRTVDEFAPDDIDYLRTVCQYIALAQQRALCQRELERQVLERTAELREKVGEMEAFSYSISHDLRTPLRTMRGYSQVLLEDYAGRLDDLGADYLSRIEQSAGRLDQLIRDILTYSRTIRGELPLGLVPLESLVENLIGDNPAFQLPQAEITLSKPIPAVVGNESALTQCFFNLLSNAVKFVAPNVRPQICIFGEELGRDVRIYIQDNGIGIDPAHFERIFQIFGRLHREADFEGTGIGLAIVKKAVERMNGTLGLNSKPGNGSCFWIQLPAAEATAEKSQTQEMELQPAH